ncbi:MAG: hypothetical protein ACPGJV_03685 [Bacteriovoracaceae bacterium]
MSLSRLVIGLGLCFSTASIAEIPHFNPTPRQVVDFAKKLDPMGQQLGALKINDKMMPQQRLLTWTGPKAFEGRWSYVGTAAGMEEVKEERFTVDTSGGRYLEINAGRLVESMMDMKSMQISMLEVSYLDLNIDQTNMTAFANSIERFDVSSESQTTIYPSVLNYKVWSVGENEYLVKILENEGQQQFFVYKRVKQ